MSDWVVLQNRTCLHWAAYKGSAVTVQWCIANGMDQRCVQPNLACLSIAAPSWWCFCCSDPDVLGRLPLHWAAKQNNTQVVMFLVRPARLSLAWGVNADAVRQFALFLMQVGELEHSDYDLISSKDSEGKTPLQVRFAPTPRDPTRQPTLLPLALAARS